MHSNYVSCAIYFYIITDILSKIQRYCKFINVYNIKMYKNIDKQDFSGTTLIYDTEIILAISYIIRRLYYAEF